MLAYARTKNAESLLITNPKLVETGVNLHEHGYSTIIFFEIEYSLYVLWQAMSPVWRPGQTRKVKIFFSPRCFLSSYSGTLEEKALSRMGRKMMAGQLLYGEDVTSALVEDTGDASLAIDLIRAIQDEEDLAIRPDTQILRIHTIRGTMGSDTVTDSLSSGLYCRVLPTMRSRPLTTAEQWLRDRGLTMADVKPKRARRKKAKVPENQLSFLDALPKVA